MKLEKSIYPNLDALLKEKNRTWEELALKVDIPLALLYLHKNGTYSFSVREAKQIKQVLGTDMPLEELFDTEGN